MKPGPCMFLFMSAWAGAGAGIGDGTARATIPDRAITPDRIMAADPGPEGTVAIMDHGGKDNRIIPNLTGKESPCGGSLLFSRPVYVYWRVYNSSARNRFYDIIITDNISEKINQTR